MMASTQHLKSLVCTLFSSVLFFGCSKNSESPEEVVDPALPTVPQKYSKVGADAGKVTKSGLGYTTFTRSSKKPYGQMDIIYYNTEEVINEAIENIPQESVSIEKGLQKSTNGLVEWGIKQGRGTEKSYLYNGKRYNEGSEGQTYSIVVKNISQSRLDTVLSVDGLDIINGESASTSNKGYIISPGDSLEIKGFRTSEEEVLPFTFSGVSSDKSGRITLALFTEKGFDPVKGDLSKN